MKVASMDRAGQTKVCLTFHQQCNDTLLIESDLDPVPPEQRTWGAVDYWAYWCSDMLAPPLASTVSSVMALGFTARETIPIVFFGFAICSVVITLTGKMGATYAVPFPVIIRSVFGMYGSFPAICIRGRYNDHAVITTRLTLLSVCRTDVDGDTYGPSWQLSPAMLGSNLA
jgi:cytosine/uracil/thiamine/allantoin permease